MTQRLTPIAGLLICLVSLGGWSGFPQPEAPQKPTVRLVGTPALYNECLNAITLDGVHVYDLALSAQDAKTSISVEPFTTYVSPQFKKLKNDTTLVLRVDLKRGAKQKYPGFAPFETTFRVLPPPPPKVVAQINRLPVEPLQPISAGSKLTFSVVADPAFLAVSAKSSGPPKQETTQDANYKIKKFEIWKQAAGGSFTRVRYAPKPSKPGPETSVTVDLDRVSGLAPGQTRVALRAAEIVRVNYLGKEIPVDMPLHQRTVILEIGR